MKRWLLVALGAFLVLLIVYVLAPQASAQSAIAFSCQEVVFAEPPLDATSTFNVCFSQPVHTVPVGGSFLFASTAAVDDSDFVVEPFGNSTFSGCTLTGSAWFNETTASRAFRGTVRMDAPECHFAFTASATDTAGAVFALVGHVEAEREVSSTDFEQLALLALGAIVVVLGMAWRANGVALAGSLAMLVAIITEWVGAAPIALPSAVLLFLLFLWAIYLGRRQKLRDTGD